MPLQNLDTFQKSPASDFTLSSNLPPKTSSDDRLKGEIWFAITVVGVSAAGVSFLGPVNSGLRMYDKKTKDKETPLW